MFQYPLPLRNSKSIDLLGHVPCMSMLLVFLRKVQDKTTIDIFCCVCNFFMT